jgi:spermidine synthase
LSTLLGLIFFLSGASALLFETLWFFQTGLALGNSIWASSLVLASFMAGLALGNGIASRFGHWIRRPVAVYAGLEVVIGVSGAGLVFLLPELTPLLAPILGPLVDEPTLLNSLRLGIGFLLMLVPATAMGVTLPILVAAVYGRDQRFGHVLGRLYGWNTLGAVAGALLGDALLIGWFGIEGSALFAAGLNGLVAVLALFLSPHLGASPIENVTPWRRRISRRGWALLGAAFLAGGGLLALEVIWFRFLLFFIPGTSFTFAVMLAVVLAGIGLGGFAGSALLSRWPEAFRFSGTVALLAGGLAIWLYTGFEIFLPESGRMLKSGFGDILSLALPLMLPVALCSGALFPWLGEALHREIGGETRSAGLLTLANTTGAAIGSLLGGFVLLPTIGVEASLLVLAGGYIGTAALAFAGGARPQKRLARWSTAALGAALLASLALFPLGQAQDRFLARALSNYVPPEKVISVREGLTETLVHTRQELFGEALHYRLITNGHSMSATSLGSHRYMKLFVYLPVAVHKAPRTALLISFGVGGTARALADTDELESIDIVDISRDILELSRLVAWDASESTGRGRTQSPLDDPRTQVHIEDGRFFLQTTDRHFDIITGEPPPPKLAGIVNLYTREYFELIRERLAPGGVTSYWVPVHSLLIDDTKSILRAFCDVFADCTLWTGSGRDWVLLGTKEGRSKVDRERFGLQWRKPSVARELRAVGFEEPGQIGALFLADHDQIAAMTADVLPLVDDFPKRLSNRVGGSTYEAWMNPVNTRKRFIKSRVLRESWPPELIAESLPYFDQQDEINRIFGYKGGTKRPGVQGNWLPRIHDLLTETTLRTFPLWLMDSSVDIQRLARIAARKGSTTGPVHYHLGAGAFVTGNWREASRHFGRTLALQADPNVLPYHTYALCRAGFPERGLRQLAAVRAEAEFSENAALLSLLENICTTP